MHFIAVCIGITDIWNNVPFFTAQHLYYAVFIFNYTSCKTWTFHISRKKVAIHYTNRGIIPAFICNFKFTIYIIAFPLSLLTRVRMKSIDREETDNGMIRCWLQCKLRLCMQDTYNGFCCTNNVNDNQYQTRHREKKR